MADKSLTLSCAQSGTSFTTKLNDALEAINTMRSGSSAPTNNLEDGVMWLDTSGADKVIKIRIGGVFHPLLDFDGSNWYAERAEEATKLATARDITLTGKVTGTASFDGTANATITTTLDTSGTWTGTATSATSAGTASTASKLNDARTITLGTDLSGNVNFDGSANVTLNASLVADTVGDSELAAGGTLGDGKVLTGTSPTAFSWEDPAGGLGEILNLKAEANTNIQTGSFVPSSDFIMVTGCGGGGTGTAVTSEPNTSRGPGGGSGGGVFQAKVYVTAGATYDVSVPGRVEGGGGNSAGSDGGDTTITLNGGGVILTLGGGGGAGIGVTGSAGSGGTVTATEGTATGNIDPDAITIQGNSGRPGGSDTQRGTHWGGCGIFGSRDTYTNSSSGTDNATNFTGNQFGRGSDGTRSSSRQSVGGFITILY